MSEENKTQPTPPPTPVAKTSAVPLKKETVRITLRARPGAGLTQPKELTTPIPSTTGTAPVPRPITTSVTPAGAATARVPTAPVIIASKATAPIQLPSAPLPPPAARMATTQVQLPPSPMAPPSPSGAPPRPNIGPPRPPGAPSAPGIPPTVPLAKIPAGAGAGGPPRPPGMGAPKPAPGAPRMEPGATTVPLSKAPPGGPPRPGAAPTGPGAKVSATQQLPKATVQLAKGTQPLAQPAITPPSAPVKRVVDDNELQEDEKDPEAGLAPLAIVTFVVGTALMLMCMFGTDKVVAKFPQDTSVFSSLMVPTDTPPTWEEKQLDGTHISKFNKVLDDIKKKLE